MNILAIDTSTSSLSVCIMQDDVILGEINLNNGLVHSTTLMPTIDSLFNLLDFDKKSLDLIATSVGPGSFTGIRIGVATANAFAMALNIPVISISSLDALAMNFANCESTIIATIDAQRDNFYTGVYKVKNGVLENLIENTVMSNDDLEEYIKSLDGQILIVGDKKSSDINANIIFASEKDNYIKSSNLAILSKDLNSDDSYANPVYMRKSQAEIVYDEKNKDSKSN